jgi:hypothetical protein
MYNIELEQESKDALSRLFENIQAKFQISPSKSLTITAIWFSKAGGVRGIALWARCEKLDEFGIIEGIERVAGTSSGAIAATLSVSAYP